MHDTRQSLTNIAHGIATRIVAGALDLVMPRVCVLCERLLSDAERLVCTRCWSALDELPHPTCARCGHPTRGRDCRWCSLLGDHIAGARSVCWVPEGVGGELVHRLKYDGWTALGACLAERMAALTPTWRKGERVVLVPVPLARHRLRERGTNQSALIANALGAEWRVAVSEQSILRMRETRSQVRLTQGERSANVHGAFVAGPAARAMRGAHVVVIDDVVTTGATLNACAAAAVTAGAAGISYFTFGRARAAYDRTPHPRSESRWLYASASTASAALAARFSAPPRNGKSET